MFRMYASSNRNTRFAPCWKDNTGALRQYSTHPSFRDEEIVPAMHTNIQNVTAATNIPDLLLIIGRSTGAVRKYNRDKGQGLR